ncbi:MAG: SDR family oxidoreductase [Chitinophagales bacterium]|nr:SDR family oxidoreductase [Chitinophagales bacterium]
MALKNNNQFALITGATSGFGYELAKLFAQDGYNLVLVARLEDRLQEVADEIINLFGVEVIPLPKDLFDPNAPFEIYDDIKAQGIAISVLVNNAGQGEYGKFSETDLDRELDIIQLNVGALVSLTKLFLKEMVERNEGKILQLGSVVSTMPAPMMAVYGATKAFVLSFSEALINELKGTNVTLTALLPGASDTDFFHKAHAEDTVTYREEKLSKPADVARDGYEALMKGESKIVSGWKNKVQVGIVSSP